LHNNNNNNNNNGGGDDDNNNKGKMKQNLLMLPQVKGQMYFLSPDRN
jgi:hypothetical protein